jgi:hypothetical protein
MQLTTNVSNQPILLFLKYFRRRIWQKLGFKNKISVTFFKNLIIILAFEKSANLLQKIDKIAENHNIDPKWQCPWVC